jgi:hypothetical protein
MAWEARLLFAKASTSQQTGQRSSQRARVRRGPARFSTVAQLELLILGSHKDPAKILSRDGKSGLSPIAQRNRQSANTKVLAGAIRLISSGPGDENIAAILGGFGAGWAIFNQIAKLDIRATGALARLEARSSNA